MKLYEQPSHQLTEVEQEQAALLVEAGLLVKGDDGLFLTLPVITQTCKAAIYDALRSAVQPLADKYEGPIARLGEEKLLPHLRPNLLEEFVHWAMSGAFFTIDLVMDFGIHQAKTLAIPEDYSRSAAGLCLYVDRSFSK